MALTSVERAQILTQQAGYIALKKLRIDRERDGYAQFLFDLKDPKYNQKGTHWSLTTGLLNITPEGLRDRNTLAEVEAIYHGLLSERSWCQRPNSVVPQALEVSSNPAQLPDGKGYGVSIKLLGKNGANSAVDPVLLLQANDGSLKVLMIKRFDGSRAFPGGMQESNVLNTCIQELLEEVFSDDLFAQESATAQAIHEQKTQHIEQVVVGLINNNEDFKKLRPHVRQLQEDTEEAINPAAYIRQLCKSIDAIKELDAHTRAHFMVHIKCCLYQSLLPEYYKKFVAFVTEHVTHGTQRINAADPRNTDGAWMVTTPLNIVLQEGNPEFEDMLDKTGLCISGGDDASDAKFISIDGIDKVYSSHGEILLDSIAQMLQQGKLDDTEVLNEQLTQIGQQLLEITQNLEKPQSEQYRNGPSA